MRDERLMLTDHKGTARRSHCGKQRVAPSMAVDGFIRLLECIAKTFFNRIGGIREVGLLDCVDGKGARFPATPVTTHPVGDNEDLTFGCRRIETIYRELPEGVLVFRSNEANVSATPI
jgi:hypothetical protein